MNLVEEIESLSPPIRGIVEGLLQSVRQKWIENASVFLYRAEINATVARECTAAGFSDAADHFSAKTIWLLAQAFECFANAERFTKKIEPCAAIQLTDKART